MEDGRKLVRIEKGGEGTEALILGEWTKQAGEEDWDPSRWKGSGGESWILQKGRQGASRMARRLVLAVAWGADGNAGLQVEA